MSFYIKITTNYSPTTESNMMKTSSCVLVATIICNWLLSLSPLKSQTIGMDANWGVDESQPYRTWTSKKGATLYARWAGSLAFSGEWRDGFAVLVEPSGYQSKILRINLSDQDLRYLNNYITVPEYGYNLSEIKSEKHDSTVATELNQEKIIAEVLTDKLAAPMAAGLIIFVLTIVLLPIAIHLNSLLTSSKPGVQGYKWGYYIGLMNVVFLPIAMAFYLADDLQSKKGDEVLWVFIYAIIQFSLSVGVIRRLRASWVPFTLLSLNPAIYLINGIYIYKRWSELGE